MSYMYCIIMDYTIVSIYIIYIYIYIYHYWLLFVHLFDNYF